MPRKYQKIFSKGKTKRCVLERVSHKDHCNIVFVINNGFLLAVYYRNYPRLSVIYCLVELFCTVYREYIVEHVYLVDEEDILKSKCFVFWKEND